MAIDDSTSMLWARVMRGISSIANSVTPRAATASIAACAVERLGKADHHLSDAQLRGVVAAARRRWRRGARTMSTTSAAPEHVPRETMRAPLAA